MGRKKDELAGDLLRGRKIKKKVVPTEQKVAEVAEKVANQKSQPQENQSEPEVTQSGQPSNTPEPEVAQSQEQSNTPAQPQEEGPPTPTNEVEKKLIRTTIDLPAYVHKAIKVKAAQEGISLKKYLVSLVKSDLHLK